MSKKDCIEELVGRRFNKLIIIGPAPTRGKWRRFVLCQCACPNKTIKEVALYRLKSGETQSCGCLRSETAIRLSTKHGQSSRSVTTVEYRTWAGMKSRCYDVNSDDYDNYGGRGVKVCKRWHNFPDFFADVGKRPKGLTLDRIDNDGNYSCGMCEECLVNGWTKNWQWATRKEQAEHRRSTRWITYQGRTQCAQAWANEVGLTRRTITIRLDRLGWTVEEALETPARHYVIDYQSSTSIKSDTV